MPKKSKKMKVSFVATVRKHGGYEPMSGRITHRKLGVFIDKAVMVTVEEL